MSNELKLEKIEDILQINQDKLKAAEAKAVIKKVKQMLKVDKIEGTQADEVASEYPNTAVAVLGNRLYKVKFDPETKKARVDGEPIVDSRDVRGRNHMAVSAAEDMIRKMSKER